MSVRKKTVGKRSVLFQAPPVIIGAGSVAGEKEGNGVLENILIW